MGSPLMVELQKLYPYLGPYGHGQPKDCRHRVAIVVPYRDRESHLRILLHNLHSFLIGQQFDYAIIIIEQIVNQTFKRAKLMNVCFAEGMKLCPWDVLSFMMLIFYSETTNLYSCPTIPRHMSVAEL